MNGRPPQCGFVHPDSGLTCQQDATKLHPRHTYGDGTTLLVEGYSAPEDKRESKGKLKEMAATVHRHAAEQRQALGGVAHARHTDPETSHWAAESLGELTELQIEVLGIFTRQGALIDEELYAYWLKEHPGSAYSTPRTRRQELVSKGYLVWNGERRENAKGKLCRVHETTVAPVAAVATGPINLD